MEMFPELRLLADLLSVRVTEKNFSEENLNREVQTIRTQRERNLSCERQLMRDGLRPGADVIPIARAMNAIRSGLRELTKLEADGQERLKVISHERMRLSELERIISNEISHREKTLNLQRELIESEDSRTERRDG